MHRSVGPISFECKAFTVCFPPRFLNSGFWARGRLYTVWIGEKIKRSCTPSWKKIEARGELNCMSRGLGCDDKAAAGKWTTRCTLQPHWLDCTHTNWILKKPRDSIPTRPEAGYSGFREVSDKGGGWVEVRNRGVTFHPDPTLLLLPLPLQLPACPPGGFSSLTALGGVAHRRLGESSQPAAAAVAQKVHRGHASSFIKLYGADLFLIRLYTPKRRTFVHINRSGVFFFFFLFEHLRFCERMYLSPTFYNKMCARCWHI